MCSCIQFISKLVVYNDSSYANELVIVIKMCKVFSKVGVGTDFSVDLGHGWGARKDLWAHAIRKKFK